MSNKEVINVDKLYNKYENTDVYHINGVVGISNGILDIKKNGTIRKVPIILVGDNRYRAFDDKRIGTHYDEPISVSILNIIEKYVLYNINKPSRSILHLQVDPFIETQVMHELYENINEPISNNITSIKTNIDSLTRDLKHQWTANHESIINTIRYFKLQLMPDEDLKQDLIPDVDIKQIDVDSFIDYLVLDITRCIDNLENSTFFDISNLDCGGAFERNVGYLEAINLQITDCDTIINGLSKINGYFHIKQLLRMVSTIRAKYISLLEACDFYKEISTRVKNRYASLPLDTAASKLLELIYTGGYLKPLFRSNNIFYGSSKIKCHLQLVETLTSVIDNVEIYNIDYCTIIIKALGLLSGVSSSQDWTAWSGNRISAQFDKIVNSAYLVTDTQPMRNPIHFLYIKLSEPERIAFKKTFISSILKTGYIKSDYSTSKAYWIVDLYSLLQFVYMVNSENSPSILFCIFDFIHKTLHYNFLKEYYGADIKFLDISKDSPYSSDKIKEIKVSYAYDAFHKNEMISADVAQYIHKQLLDINNLNDQFNLDYTLSAAVYNQLSRKTYESFLSSYQFITTYPKQYLRFYKCYGYTESCRLDKRNQLFTLDIMNNFNPLLSNDIQIKSFNAYQYNTKQQDAVLNCIKNLSYLFDDLPPNENKDDEKLVVGGAGKYQDELLYKIQTDFANYHMKTCGFNNPVEMINYTKVYLLMMNIAELVNSKKVSINTRSSVVGLPIKSAPDSLEPWQRPNESSMVPVQGGTALYIIKILLISATVIALILLLCGILANQIATGRQSTQYTDHSYQSISPQIDWSQLTEY